MTIVLTDEMYGKLESYAKRRDWTKSKVVEEALWGFFYDEAALSMILLSPEVRDKLMAAMMWAVGGGKQPKKEDMEKLHHAYQAVK